MSKQSPQTKAKKAVKKAAKSNPKAIIIAVVAIILIIAIAACVVYFVFPDTWNEIISIIQSTNSSDSPTTPPSSNLVHSDGTLLVEYVDVEQGDCQIIMLPDGKTMIIDGGDKGYAAKVKSAMDELSITKFDYVLLTHTDSDHCGALDDAINYATYVENIYLPKIRSKEFDLGLSSDYCQVTTIVYNDFITAAKNATYLDNENNEKSANLIFTEDIITIEDDAHTYKLTMYCRNDEYYKSMDTNAHDLNDVSPISVLEFNNRTLLFTGDANSGTDAQGKKIETSSEQNFLSQMASLGYTDETFDADILKVPHHGGKDSSGSDFLDFIDVEYAIVCVGGTQSAERTEYALFINETFADASNYKIYENEKYGHPTYQVCSEGGRLDKAGVQYAYYTWFNGDITCTIDKNGAISFACQKTAILNGETVTFE